MDKFLLGFTILFSTSNMTTFYCLHAESDQVFRVDFPWRDCVGVCCHGDTLYDHTSGCRPVECFTSQESQENTHPHPSTTDSGMWGHVIVTCRSHDYIDV